MASIINSTTTSPGGLISTGDSSNSLLIQTGDTTAITVNGSQVVSLTNPLPVASGGTGINAAGTAGNVLTSNGSAWVSAAAAAFDSGTLMLFQQTAAPTGWTKQTTHNDKALRVVSGSASSGGSSSFTTVFTNQTPTINTSGLSAGATTLSTTQIPSHTHPYQAVISGGFVSLTGCGFLSNGSQSLTTSATGGGGSHTHSVSGSATSSAITLAVQYVDLIIASKN
jgi:hypothetical protein